MKYGFVYIWFDKTKKRFYIGSHWGTEEDGYICSSRFMHYAKRKRPNDFKRRILARVNDRVELLTEEHKWLSLIPDDQLGKKYYNLTKHHPGHWTATSKAKTVSEKLSDTFKAKHQNPEYQKIYRKGRKKMQGRAQKAEHKEKRLEAVRKGKQNLEHKKAASEHMKQIWALRRAGKLSMPVH